MPAPAQTLTWTYSVNNRITYVSINNVMGNYLKGVADFLLANGYTCKGSSDGAAAAMDGTNRWVSVAAASTRGANTTTANSWMVMTDGNGIDLCLSYVGTADNNALFLFSPSGSFVAAGTPTFTPTATDSINPSNATDFIDASASLDRIWNGWVDSTATSCRFCVFRNNTCVGTLWGLEEVVSRVDQTWSPTSWGFEYSAANSIYGGPNTGINASYTGLRGGRILISGVTLDVNGGCPVFMNSSVWGNVQTEIQGGVGYPMFPCSVGTNASTLFKGIVGNLYDWWTFRSSSAPPGDTIGGLTWIVLGHNSTNNGFVWPWDGSTVPATS